VEKSEPKTSKQRNNQIDMTPEKQAALKHICETFGFHRVIVIGSDTNFSYRMRLTLNLDVLQSATLLRVEEKELIDGWVNPQTIIGGEMNICANGSSPH
jgi:hypothetical protein